MKFHVFCEKLTVHYRARRNVPTNRYLKPDQSRNYLRTFCAEQSTTQPLITRTGWHPLRCDRHHNPSYHMCSVAWIHHTAFSVHIHPMTHSDSTCACRRHNYLLLLDLSIIWQHVCDIHLDHFEAKVWDTLKHNSVLIERDLYLLHSCDRASWQISL
jgi:hypothetical protein